MLVLLLCTIGKCTLSQRTRAAPDSLCRCPSACYCLPEKVTAAGAKLEFTEAPDPNLADGSTGVGGGYDKFLAEMAEVVNMQPLPPWLLYVVHRHNVSIHCGYLG